MDPEFGRGRSEWSKSWSGDQQHGVNPILGPVSEPPFCGVRLYPTGAGSAGLLTDSKARVMHVRGHAIPGLYACGNAAAPTAYGAGYQAGLTLMGGMIFGYLAARDASRP
jgi:3-oxosteroid 1-dehydrogenase